MTPSEPSAASQLAAEPALLDPAQRYRTLAPRAPDRPFEIFEFFPPNAEIELEIGFGRGLFLLQRAQVARDAFLWGLEIKTKLAYQVAERCAELDATRVRVMAGDVRTVLTYARPNHVLARAFMNFPDPWWKKRHAKRRLIGPELLDQLARLLRPGGEFFVQTDVEERALEAREELEAHGAFTLDGAGFVEANPYGAMSNRERRAIADGLPVYRLVARSAAGVTSPG